ncbi:MAG TPA: BON domain-containing protein [Candidatus Dormibacteraeota bacterium]|nr:BON domain-containing protein [Candidatus Dormibacteraeota bacterium]
MSRALPSQGLIGMAVGAATSALALGAVTRVGAIGWAWGDRRRLASGRIDATALDAETAQRVEHELFVARGIPAGRVNVTADRGTVTIRGAAGSRRQADEIVGATETVAGSTRSATSSSCRATAARARRGRS